MSCRCEPPHWISKVPCRMKRTMGDLTHMHSSVCMYVFLEYAAHFHVQVEEWNDRDETVPKETYSWQSVQKRRQTSQV